MPMTPKRLLCFAVYPTIVLVVGCGRKADGAAEGKAPESRALAQGPSLHEPCLERRGRIERSEHAAGKFPELQRVFELSGREACRAIDLNRDGRPEMFEYFDEHGELRRREMTAGDSGRVEAVDFFANGKRIRREYDTRGVGQIDTRDYYNVASGERVRRERDADGDGKVDQWSVWHDGKVTTTVDRNGDGMPEPDSAVTTDSKADDFVAASKK